MEAEKGIDSLTAALKMSENELRTALNREEQFKRKLKDMEPEMAKIKIENKTLIKNHNLKVLKIMNFTILLRVGSKVQFFSATLFIIQD